MSNTSPSAGANVRNSWYTWGVLPHDGHFQSLESNRLLQASPHALVHAEDAADGQSRFHEAKPDLVFLAQGGSVDAEAFMAAAQGRAQELGTLLFVTRKDAAFPSVGILLAVVSLVHTCDLLHCRRTLSQHTLQATSRRQIC